MEEIYQINLARGNQKRIMRVQCTPDYIRRVVNETFKGRFRKPEKLNVSDGVKMIVSSDKVLFGRRIYNKSVLQVMTSLKKAISNTPL